MGIMVYSLLWVMQDLYHQPYCTSVVSIVVPCFRAESIFFSSYKASKTETTTEIYRFFPVPKGSYLHKQLGSAFRI